MIYLDNAATTFPKPISVVEEMDRCMREYGGNPGRGAHSLSLAAAGKVFECREELCDMFCASDVDRVFFTPNTTYGINTVLKGLLKKGDHVLISDMEHNAVWRPIERLAREGVIQYDVFKTYAESGYIAPWRICKSIERLMRPDTKAVVCTHASNICSFVMPVKEIGALCKRKGVLLITDGAQAAGHERIDIKEMNISALCIPGHKGLYGPQGSGAVILGDGVVLDTIIEGGNGVASLEPEMPLQSPERYEAGTLSTPCIAGLCEGIRAVRSVGIDEIAYGERQMGRRICEILGNIKNVKLYASSYLGSIALFNVVGIPSEVVANELDKRGVCARAGYHCAALAHKTLDTPQGGAVRLSVGMYNKPSDLDELYKSIASISQVTK
jgi:cysteine desulfurase family protein